MDSEITEKSKPKWSNLTTLVIIKQKFEISSWNCLHGSSRKILFNGVHWSRNVLAQGGKRPQDFIDQDILYESDALVAIFRNRFGSDTGKYASGTLEEIEESIRMGKITIVFFSKEPVSRDQLDLWVNRLEKDGEEYFEVKKEIIPDDIQNYLYILDRINRNNGKIQYYQIDQGDAISFGDNLLINQNSNREEFARMKSKIQGLLEKGILEKVSQNLFILTNKSYEILDEN
ncbi:MAG: hypothetical protein JJT78_08490, partial [Leptospira sp.]|nr:hypothetical protein [Leptospira sp.]